MLIHEWSHFSHRSLDIALDFLNFCNLILSLNTIDGGTLTVSALRYTLKCKTEFKTRFLMVTIWYLVSLTRLSQFYKRLRIMCWSLLHCALMKLFFCACFVTQVPIYRPFHYLFRFILCFGV